jgi:hypothetical protein
VGYTVLPAQASIPNNLEIAEASRPTGEKSEKPMRAQSLDYPFQPDDRLGHYHPDVARRKMSKSLRSHVIANHRWAPKLPATWARLPPFHLPRKPGRSGSGRQPDSEPELAGAGAGRLGADA